MSRYAEGTTVEPEKSQADISGALRRYGVVSQAYAWEGSRAVVMFTAGDPARRVRFVLDLPTDAKAYRLTDGGRTRDAKGMQAALDAEVRRLWRCLLLAIKAKLEVVESGIATFEDEFLAHIVLPDGTTVAEQVRPQLDRAYSVEGAHTRVVLAIGDGR